MKTIGTLGMIAKGMPPGALHRARLEEPVAKKKAEPPAESKSAKSARRGRRQARNAAGKLEKTKDSNGSHVRQGVCRKSLTRPI